MLYCCSTHFMGSFSRVLYNTKNNYRKIEFGVCPVCGCSKFKDFIQGYNGKEVLKEFSGKTAQEKLNKWRKKLRNMTQGSWSKQNVYYGDFRKTRKKDENGNLIYLQLRRNFNNEAEIIGEITTININD